MTSKKNIFLVGSLDGKSNEIKALYNGHSDNDITHFESEAALFAIINIEPDLIIVDPFSPLFRNHASIVKKIKNTWRSVNIIMLTNDKNTFYLKQIKLGYNDKIIFFKELQNSLIVIEQSINSGLEKQYLKKVSFNFLDKINRNRVVASR
jgi:DNA-binding NarL/FixJ family response regulator